MNRFFKLTPALILLFLSTAVCGAETSLWQWTPPGTPVSPPTLLGSPHALLVPLHQSLAIRPSLVMTNIELWVDFESDSIRRTASVLGVDVDPPVSCSLAQYVSIVDRDKRMTLWKREARRGIRDLGEIGTRGGLFSVDLPIQFPKAVQAIVGKGKPNLRVTGSETIAFSGNSSWTVGQQYSEYGKQSKFPRLDMRQDLVVKLDGTIGDKIDVDWDQSSAARTELENRIRIRYRGYDDEIIQSVDLGNTNLSIPNTQYVSYSGSHEGLFGIKSVAKLGSVDLTMIASKQEGKPDKQRIVGGAKLVHNQISDLDNRKRTYFFLDVPEFGKAPSLIDVASVEVFIDDLNGYNNQEGTIPGVAYLFKSDGTKDTTYFEGNFDKQLPEEDYHFEYFYGPYFPILVIDGALPANHVMAVAYKEVVGGSDRWTGSPDPYNLELKMIVPPDDELELDLTKGRWAALRKNELRNVYYLGSEAIIKESFRLSIKKRSGGAGVDEEALNEIPYIEILGLDRRGPTAGTPPDGLIDEDYIDLDRGILLFPDLQPFFPDSFDIHAWNAWDRPDTLRGDEGNVHIYEKKFPNYYLDTRFYLDVEYKSPQTTFYLGWNILENSEVVTLNGVRLAKGTDYTIEYETGELRLLTPAALEPTADVSVDFSRASLFGLSKTLLGVSSQYKPTDEFSLATTWLYESKGTTEERPRLEQEPSRTVVGGVSGSFRLTPGIMTSLVDALPLVETREPSSLALSGEFGVSIPNPNTRNEVYIDDMEGNKETRPLGLLRSQWRLSSLPDDPLLLIQPAGQRAIWWYNLHPEFHRDSVVHEGDLFPERSPEERERVITTLELYVAQTGGWQGLTQVFSWLGEDFTEMQNIEVWVNDFGLGRELAREVKIDLGVVSEDSMWDPDSLPNSRLDTEDQNRNGVLDLTPADEDTGLNGILGDDDRDDYWYNPDKPFDFSHINGTEGNRKVTSHPTPDTEDLDGDGILDTRQDYFEFTVDLSQDSRYQVRDNGNGWRLFRIPLSDSAVVSVGQPRWDNVKHARLWLNGFAAGEKLQLGGMEVVGNRWIISPVANEDSYKEGERLFVGVINNKEHGNIYQPPFDPGEENNVPKKEQSLVLSTTNLFPGDTVSTYKSFAGGNDYTQYETLKFWVRGNSDSLVYFLRFGTDSLNYYEYATPVPMFWDPREFKLADLSIVKLGTPGAMLDTTLYTPDGGWFRLRGRPSFTRVQRITMGLVNMANRTGSTMVASDTVWVDELRLTSVKKEVGTARRIFAEAKFADFLTFSTHVESRGEDFLSIGRTRGSGSRISSYSVSGVMSVDKFLPKDVFHIPLSFALSESKSVPKFITGDDVVLTKEYEEVQTTKNGSRTLGASFRKLPSPNRWLRYTLESIGLGFSINETYASNVTRVDSTRTLSGTFSYKFSPTGKPAINIPIGRGRSIAFFLLPTTISFTGRGTSSRSKSYERAQDDPLYLIPRSDVKRKVGDFALQASYSPFSNLRCNYNLNTSRDWLLYNPSELLGGINIGTEVSRTQSFRAEFSPRLGTWLSPNANFAGSYREDHRPEITREYDVSDVRNISNSGTLSFGMGIPIARLSQVIAGQSKAPTDSTRGQGNSGLAAISSLIGKLGDIRANHSISYGSQYSRIYGKPNVSYMFGIRRATGGNVALATDGVMSVNIGHTTTVTANGRLFKGFSLDAKFETSDREVESLTGIRVEERTVWPEVRAGWNDVQKQLGLGSVVRSLRLDSTFRRTSEESGNKGQPSERIISRSDWSPLLNLSATWAGGMRTSYTSSISSTETESQLGAGYTSTTTTSSHSLNIQKTLDATKGFSLPFASGRKIRLKSSVNLGLTVQFSTMSSVIPPSITQKTDNLSVTARATYSFSANLSGNFNFGFTQSRDLQVGITKRSLRLGLSASFRF